MERHSKHLQGWVVRTRNKGRSSRSPRSQPVPRDQDVSTHSLIGQMLAHTCKVQDTENMEMAAHGLHIYFLMIGHICCLIRLYWIHSEVFQMIATSHVNFTLTARQSISCFFHLSRLPQLIMLLAVQKCLPPVTHKARNGDCIPLDSDWQTRHLFCSRFSRSQSMHSWFLSRWKWHGAGQLLTLWDPGSTHRDRRSWGQEHSLLGHTSGNPPSPRPYLLAALTANSLAGESTKLHQLHDPGTF